MFKFNIIKIKSRVFLENSAYFTNKSKLAYNTCGKLVLSSIWKIVEINIAKHKI